MSLKEEDEKRRINNTKLFHKIAHKGKKTHFEVVKSINNKKKTIKEMVTTTFGKVNLQRKPSALKIMEKGMKELFFGRKGIVTKQVSTLEKEMVKSEIKKKNKLENKIFIGTMPYLTIRDTTKGTEKYKTNDVIRRQLMRSSNYTLIPKVSLFSISNRINSKESGKANMNRTITATNDKHLRLFQTGVGAVSISAQTSGIGNYTFYKRNTKRVIKDSDSHESPSYSQFKTSTCNSPIKNIKGMALNITSIGQEANNEPKFQQYLKPSMIDTYNKTTNHTDSNGQPLLSHRSIRSGKRKTQLNILTAITQTLHSKINNLNNSSTKVENNLLTLIDSANANGSPTAGGSKQINQSQLLTDYEMIFNKKIKHKKKPIETRESIQKKFNLASSMIDPIKVKMKQLQSRIHKLTDKQAESLADEIASKYLQNRNDAVYNDEEKNYAEMTCRTQSKEVRDMKRRILEKSTMIMKMSHNLNQEKVKLMNKYTQVNSKDKAINHQQSHLDKDEDYFV